MKTSDKINILKKQQKKINKAKPPALGVQQITTPLIEQGKELTGNIQQITTPLIEQAKELTGNIQQITTPLIGREFVTPFIELGKELTGFITPFIEQGKELTNFMQGIAAPLKKIEKCDTAILKISKQTAAIKKTHNLIPNFYIDYAQNLTNIAAIIQSEKITADNERLKTENEINTTDKPQNIAANYETVKYNYLYNAVLEENERLKIDNKAKDKQIEKIQNTLIQCENELKMILSKKDNRPPATPNNTNTPKALTLHPTLSPTQIIKLYEKLKNIFICNLDNWNGLFNEAQINIKKPLRAAAPADIVVFIEYLQQNRFIETRQPISILVEAGAFTIEQKPIKARQLYKSKENNKFPDIGKNYKAIKAAINSIIC